MQRLYLVDCKHYARIISSFLDLFLTDHFSFRGHRLTQGCIYISSNMLNDIRKCTVIKVIAEAMHEIIKIL